MKKMLCLSILLLLAFCRCEAQNTESNDNFLVRCTNDNDTSACGIVIALSGLKLRKTPSFDGKVLASMPFGSSLTRLNPSLPENGQNAAKTADSIGGNWEKVEYRGIKGWAFNAFIGRGIFRMTEEGYLFFPNHQDDSYVYASPQFHYYGVYSNTDKTQWSMKKIKPAFYVYYSDYFSSSLKAETKEQPAFILATKKQLSEGAIIGRESDSLLFEQAWEGRKPAPKIFRQTIPGSQFSLDAVEQTETDWDGKNSRAVFHVRLTDNPSGKQQILPLLNTIEWVWLNWVGDLDRDGKMDFMLYFSGLSADGSGDGRQLFLTGSASPTQIVYPVAPVLDIFVCGL